MYRYHSGYAYPGKLLNLIDLD
eukprot:SAG11_NODE_9561_length_900_cov_1.876404_3_plen_22_part_01